MNPLGTIIGLGLTLVVSFQEKAALPPEPAAELQKEKLKVIKEVFKEEYAKRTPQDQQALAQKLLQRGLETEDDLSARFVMLREARDISAATGDVETALRAADGISKSFAVEGVLMKMAALSKAAPLARDPEAIRAVARGYLAVAGEAIGSDDYDQASSAAGKAEAAAKSGQDASLAARAAEVRRDVSLIKEEYLKVLKLEKPGSGDSDPVGRFLCFIKGDWERGLPLLGPALKALAEKDLAKPVEADKRIETGDGWWDLGQKEKNAWKRSRILARAQYWYEQAAPSASGLAKVRIEKRLEDLEALRPGVFNLLKLIDPKKDAVSGIWKLQDGKLVSDTAKFTRIEVPYKPPAEYEVRVTFSRVDGSSDVNVILSRGGKSFVCILGGGNVAFGLGLCKGVWTDKPENPTLVSIPDAFVAGRAYNALIEVRRDRVKVSVDEKQILEYKTDYSDLSMSGAWKLRDDTLLGLGSYESSVAFHKLSIVEVSGSGKRTR